MLIVANWKMNPKTRKEANDIVPFIPKDVEVVVCPPAVYLSDLKDKVDIGGQNCFWEEKGAFTGEISVPMLKDIGCKYVIVGHSERRKYFKESDRDINMKVKAVLSSDLIPILCIGETQEDRESGIVEDVVKNQLLLDLVDVSDFSKIVIAYEPVWAIGTGNACSIEDAKKMQIVIRNIVSEYFKMEKAILLYGGSVSSANSAGYVKEAGFNGLLVGGASLIPDEFVKIINSVK